MIVALALTIPVAAFAATSDSTAATKVCGFFGFGNKTLTEQQQAEVDSFAQKQAELKKSFLDAMVANGAITQEEADSAKARIDEGIANGVVDFGMMDGRGTRGDRGGLKLDVTTLTDAQKQTLLDLFQESMAQEKALATKLLAEGLLTQAQADEINTKIADEMAEHATIDTLSKNMNVHRLLAVKLLADTTLTDAQKAILTDAAAEQAITAKKAVAVYLEAGIITQAQADIMNQQIDDRAADPFSGPHGARGEGKGHGRRGRGMGDIGGVRSDVATDAGA